MTSTTDRRRTARIRYKCRKRAMPRDNSAAELLRWCKRNGIMADLYEHADGRPYVVALAVLPVDRAVLSRHSFSHSRKHGWWYRNV